MSKERGQETPKGIRLNKRLARLGVGSRRGTEQLIVAGRVKVNGRVVTDLSTRVHEQDSIAVDNQLLDTKAPALTLLLYKPQGVLCTRHDPQGRATIYDLLDPNLPFLAHVGRLDYNTEGALLMSTDGDLAQALLQPAHSLPRVYHVKTQGRLSAASKARLEAGIPLDNRPTRPIVVERLPSRSKHDWLQLTLFEGKNRHVHRIMEAVGHSVTRLRRTAFGPVTIEGLAPGQWRELSKREVTSLRDFL